MKGRAAQSTRAPKEDLFSSSSKIQKEERIQKGGGEGERNPPTAPSPIARAAHLSSSPPPYRHRPVEG